MSNQKLLMADRVSLIINVLEDMYPDAYCELNHSNDLELLIAVLLSAQSTDKSVNIITVKLFKKYNSIQDYISTDLGELENDLRQLGLFKNKAKNIKLLCIRLREFYNSEVPRSRKDLESLAGVGRKTANVMLSTAFNIPAIAVDTHVERVSKRLGLAYTNDSVLKVETKLMNKFPKEKWSKLHHQIIFFGRYHCKALNPKCNSCVLKDICNYYCRINK